jgi:hypothetical protein
MKTKKMKIKAWAAIVPGTAVPMTTMMSNVDAGTRQYVLFCDPDAEQRARQAVQVYPEGHRIAVEVTIEYEVPMNIVV